MRLARTFPLLATLLLLSPAAAVRAQDAQAAQAAQAANARLDQVEKKLDAALAEIERMKLGGPGFAGYPAPDTVVARASRHGYAPGASRIYDRPVGPSIGGYGEALFSSPDGETEGGAPSGQRPSADLLRAVFYIGHKFTPELLFNSEIEFEHAGVKDEAAAEVDPGTGEGEAELSGEATIEFAYLDWQVKPYVGVRAGKLLVPVGLTNEQHEPPIFFGARRPDVETFLIPTTWAGAGAGLYGSTESGLEWRAYYIEGLDATHFSAALPIREGRQGGSQALFTHPGLTGRLDWKGVPGLLVGVSAFTGDSWQDAQPSGASLSARVTLTDVHATFAWRGLQGRGLWTAGRQDQAGELSDALGLTGQERLGERFSGGYLEAGYDVAPLAWPGTRWMLAPYLRAETLDSQDDVPGGTEDPALERSVLLFGLAVKPHPNVVLKADREQRRSEGDGETSRWNVALGWLF
jgi:hypothetical protein